MSAFAKDMLKTIWTSRRRFISIAAIVFFGVTVMVGLKIACEDLRLSSDDFFRSNRLYDVKVQSTLGLVSDDIAALQELDGVAAAEGSWSETAYTDVDGEQVTVDVNTIMHSGINEPYVVDGRLPEGADELVVTTEYLEESHRKVGDVITFDSDGVFSKGDYTIVGEVIDPTSMATKNGSTSFRVSGAKYSFFVAPESVDPSVSGVDAGSDASGDADAADDASDGPVYTVAYLSIDGAESIYSFSSEYEKRVDEVTKEAEAIKAEREQARYDSLRAEATAKVDDAQAEADEQLAEAERKLDDAQATIDSSRRQLDDAQAQIDSQRKQLDAAARQLPGGWQALKDAQAQLEQGRSELEAAEQQWSQQKTALAENRAQAQAGIEQIDPQLAQAQAALEALEMIPDPTPEQLAQIETLRYTVSSMQAQRAELKSAIAQIDTGIAQGDAQIQAAKDELEANAAGLDQWCAGLMQIDSGRRQLDSAEAQLRSGRSELSEGQAELDSGRADYEREKANALEKIADARAQIDDIEEAEWYVQDRSALSCFASIDSDASAIEAIATVFPTIFFIVAILVALTTATRMVEEERGLIGLYKALGYGNAKIMSKYIAYTLGAALLGAALGLVAGYVALPSFLMTVFELMYILPSYNLYFDWALCLMSVGLFAGGIGLATLIACRRELSERPATLMRPKAPKAGTRILLERVKPLWSRLSFLSKVTARNLFRYKQRFFMTMFGVAGCTALMICGFAIHNTVNALAPNQYGDDSRPGVDVYDVMVVCNPSDLEKAAAEIAGSDEVSDFTAVMYDSVSATFGDEKETLQMMVVPDGFSIDGFVKLRDDRGNEFSLADASAMTGGASSTAGAFVSKNASDILGFSAGDQLTLQDSKLRQGTLTVASSVMGYIGNVVYMDETAYRNAFGTEPSPNALLVHLSGNDDQKISYAEQLRNESTFLSVVSTDEQQRDFTENFMLINYVVVLITGLAAALSFVVLFTLSNTNISERQRELATIKVLGFRRREVRNYINREMLVLALIGTLLGIPAGMAVGHLLTITLVMPSMYFAVEILPSSYLVSCALSMAFAVFVSIITNRSLDKIDMVGALKSAE